MDILARMKDSDPNGYTKEEIDILYKDSPAIHEMTTKLCLDE